MRASVVLAANILHPQPEVIIEIVTEQFRHHSAASIWKSLQVVRDLIQAFLLLKFVPEGMGDKDIVQWVCP
jgi:hypothetical protein